MEKIKNPTLQASIVAGAAITLMLLLKILGLMGWVAVDNIFYWLMAGTFLLFFGLFNSILSANSLNMNHYWSRSTSSYTALLFVLMGAAYLLSGIGWYDLGGFKFVFIVVTFGYLLFLSLMRFMRKIVEIAQKEDRRMEHRK